MKNLIKSAIRWTCTLAVFVTLIFSERAHALPGEPDPGFGPGSCTPPASVVSGFSAQHFGHSPGRVCADLEPTQVHSWGQAVALQQTGTSVETLVAGTVALQGSAPKTGFGLTRFDSAGAIDNTGATPFGVDGSVTTLFAGNAQAHDLLVQPDQSIVVVGGNGISTLLAMYAADGTLVRQSTTAPATSLWTTASGLTAAGFPDDAYGIAPFRPAGSAMPGDFIVVGTNRSGLTDEIKVARFNSLGNLVSSFGPGGLGVVTLSATSLGMSTGSVELRAFDVVTVDDHTVFVIGEAHDTATLQSEVFVAKLDGSGALDMSFTASGSPAGTVVADFGPSISPRPMNHPRAGALRQDGKLLVAGWQQPTPSAHLNAIFSVLILDAQTGAFEGSSQQGGMGARALDLAIDSRGRAVLVGESVASAVAPQYPEVQVLRLNRDLSLDTSFGGGGTGWNRTPGSPGPSTVHGVVRSVADGKLMMAASVVPDAGSAPSYITNWWSATASYEGGPVCGNGILEAGEDCESPFGGCCNEFCEFRPSTEVCRAGDGECDSEETCTGTSDVCPADAFEPAGTTCTDDGNECSQDVCDGAGSCAHPNLADGTACTDDGLFCSGVETCQAGTCTSAGDPCSSGGECADSCDEAADHCWDKTGTSCTDDGNECTDDVCDGSGSCTHPALSLGTACTGDGNECTEDICDGTGSCTHPSLSDGTACTDDGLFCTGAETCQAGTCTSGGDPCLGGTECNDNCNEAAGNCFEPATESCSPDGNECTQDMCDGAGNCDHPAEPAGTSCTDDGDACTDDICDGSGSCTHPDVAGVDVDGDGNRDNDADGVVDLCDNCMNDCNPSQGDDDGDCDSTGSDPQNCGNVCDSCPGFDETTQDAACATADYNVQNLECCWETDSTAASSDPMCVVGGDLILEVGGSSGPGDPPGGASIKIPPSCQNGEDFAITGVSRDAKEYWASHATGTFVGAYEFSPDGTDFTSTCSVPPVVCVDWVDADDATPLIGDSLVTDPKPWTKSPYAYKIQEAGIAPHWSGATKSGKIAKACSKQACTTMGADGFPSDWGGNTRTDITSLSACCSESENKYCFEITGFSSYGVVVEQPVCDQPMSSSDLKVLKLDRPAGNQKIVFKGRLDLPESMASVGFAPDQTGAQVALKSASGATIWSATLEQEAWSGETRRGWKAKGNGRQFLWLDRSRSGPPLKVILKGRSSTSTDWSVKVVASQLDLEIGSEDLPLTLTLQPNLDEVESCRRSSFAEEEGGFCASTLPGNKVMCRG